MRYSLKLTTAFIFFCNLIFTAAQDSILATMGSIEITADQFKLRYELMPIVKKGIKDQTAQKYDLLYSLIAEKLWALEAKDSNLDTSDIMSTTFKGIEKMYVRDALYKAEILNKIGVSNEEIITGAKRLSTKLKLNVLFENDSVKIFNDYYALKDSASFDSLQALSDKKVPDIEVKFGEMLKPIEDSVFALKIGEFSYPIKSSSGWIIFRLAKKIPLPNEEKYAGERFSKIKEIIIDRKKDKIYNEFYDSFFPGRSVEADRKLFLSISNKIASALKRKKEALSISDSGRVDLGSADILRIESEFGEDTLSMPFIKFEKNPLSVKEFLRYFILQGFYSFRVEPEIIAAKVSARIRTLIEHELLAREGYERGLQNLPKVDASINMWKNNMLSKIYRRNMVDSIKVTDEEVYDYYLEKKGPDNEGSLQVNILEILTDSLEVIENVLNALDSGQDFRELASVYTERKWTKDKGGEFGFFPSNMYGDIGRIAAKLEAGEIYGPLKVPEGYSLFKLIGKKQVKDSLPEFSLIKEDLKQRLIAQKTENLFINTTARLAKKYHVKINDSEVKSLEVQDLNMYTFRYFGFGGRMIAVPLTLPFTEWVKPWKESLKEIP